MSLIIIAFIVLGMAEESIVYFEDRGDAVAAKFVDLISGSAGELFSGLEVETMIGDEFAAELPEGNLCDSLDKIEFGGGMPREGMYDRVPPEGMDGMPPDMMDFNEEELRAMMEERCAEGSVDKNNLVAGAMEVQFAEFSNELSDSIQEGFEVGITESRAFLGDFKSRVYPFLDMRILSGILLILLIFYFINNDLVIVIHYIAKELVFVVTLVFLLPYVLFKTNVIGLLFEKVDLIGMLNLQLPINPQLILARAIEIVSSEMLGFYEQYLIYALVAFIAGIVLLIGNNAFLMPFFAKKLGEAKLKKVDEVKKKAEEGKEEVKEEKKEAPKKKPKKKKKK